MTIINEINKEVIGALDTHQDLHFAAVVDANGSLLSSKSFSTTRQGYRETLAWMKSYGNLTKVGVECTGTYGAGLSRYL